MPQPEPMGKWEVLDAFGELLYEENPMRFIELEGQVYCDSPIADELDDLLDSGQFDATGGLLRMRGDRPCKSH